MPVPSSGARDRRYVGFEIGAGQRDNPAGFGRSIQRHQQLHHRHPVGEGLHRGLALAEGFDHVAILRRVAIGNRFVVEDRHQALLGVLLFDQILALDAGDVA